MLQPREDFDFSRFSRDRSWTPLRGCYISPLRLLGDRDDVGRDQYFEVLEVLRVGGRDVLLTKGGGMFVRRRMSTFITREMDEEDAEVLNLLICELNLAGLWCEPLSRERLQTGTLIDRYATIVGGHGSFPERTTGPFALVASDPGPPAPHLWAPNYFFSAVEQFEAVLKKVRPMRHAPRLAAISSTVPQLVAAAYYHGHASNNAEAALTSWTVVEQLLALEWDDYLADLPAGDRKVRLRDTRTYTAAIQAEVLLTAGHLDHDLYERVQSARKIRNDLAHRARISQEGAQVCTKAMQAMLEAHLKDEIAQPHQGWGSGGGAPETELEPSFPFE
jgi:hypothetical protein